MKPFIIKEKCAADPSICPPMKSCPNSAFSYVEDENEPIGGRIEIDLEKCDGCGICVELCCGQSIEMNAGNELKKESSCDCSCKGCC